MKPNVYRHYAASRYGQLHMRIAEPSAPSARPLLCFHLSPISGVIYDSWLPEMGKDRIVIAPDTPGYGMSDPPATPPTIADFAAVMGELAESRGYETFDVMGYHTGSKICVELARQRPAQVAHLLLVSAPVYTAEELEGQYAAMGHKVVAKPDGSHLVEQWQGMWGWRGPDQTPESLMPHFADAIRGGEHRPWGHRAAFSYTYPENLADVKQPILVLNTNDDLTVPTARVAEYLVNGRVLDLPNWGHGFLDSQTEAAAKIARDFFDN